MNFLSRRNNFLGLIALFFAFTISGIILAYVYVGLSIVVAGVSLNFVLVIFFGIALFVIIQFLRKPLKVTSNIGVFFVVIIGLPFIHFFNWVFYFTWLFNESINPFLQIGTFLRYFFEYLSNHSVAHFIYHFEVFNYTGWIYVLGSTEIEVRGPFLSVFWLGEFIIISVIPVISAFSFEAVFIYSKNTWAKPKFLPYPFAVFTGEERESISRGQISTILNKPLSQSSEFSSVAICLANSEVTEYITIYNSTLNKGGNIKNSKPSKAIFLGFEKLKELENKLAQKHNTEEDL